MFEYFNKIRPREKFIYTFEHIQECFSNVFLFIAQIVSMLNVIPSKNERKT